MSIENKRKINERKFAHWEDIPDGSRKYWLEINGKHGRKRQLDSIRKFMMSITSW